MIHQLAQGLTVLEWWKCNKAARPGPRQLLKSLSRILGSLLMRGRNFLLVFVRTNGRPARRSEASCEKPDLMLISMRDFISDAAWYPWAWMIDRLLVQPSWGMLACKVQFCVVQCCGLVFVFCVVKLVTWHCTLSCMPASKQIRKLLYMRAVVKEK